MKLLLFLGIFLLFPPWGFAETNCWGRIVDLCKETTNGRNPELSTYLRGLTPTEMLEAARQYSCRAEQTLPEGASAEAVFNVGLALAFYGTEQGGITDERLNTLLEVVANDGESQFFRESLVRLIRQRYWRKLTDSQSQRCKQQFFRVVSDRHFPSALRALSCRELSLVIAEAYRGIIISDGNVRPFRSDKEKWRNLDDLVRKGEVRLCPDTRKLLKSACDEIANITSTLTALSQDAAESPEVKDRAQAALKTFADLPVPPEQ